MAQGARMSAHAHVGRARASGPGASLSTASALVLSPQPSCRFCTWPQRVPGRREEAGLALDTSASASAAGGCPVAAWGSVPPAEASASGGLGKPLPRTAQPHTGPGSWICPADGLWGCGAPLPLALLSPESRHLLPRGAGAGVSAAAVGRLRALPTPRARRPPPLALHPARRPPVAQFLPASDPVCITLGHGGRCQDVLRCLAAAPPWPGLRCPPKRELPRAAPAPGSVAGAPDTLGCVGRAGAGGLLRPPGCSHWHCWPAGAGWALRPLRRVAWCHGVGASLGRSSPGASWSREGRGQPSGPWSPCVTRCVPRWWRSGRCWAVLAAEGQVCGADQLALTPRAGGIRSSSALGVWEASPARGQGGQAGGQDGAVGPGGYGHRARGRRPGLCCRQERGHSPPDLPP